MYFDDSHTEVKVTDVTHCDLETKSILKPPKARAPLQEVDLGNHIAVEFDVIRKRRVSFAGVNKIKEFNSEAKSFSIYCTPAYEEKISTSSDSSALSTSVSGNINSLTKENDITILDDTMDLTDLSIVQPSAMDITGMKPQKQSQDIPDIFAPKSLELGLFNNHQDINRPPVFSSGINNPNVHDGLEHQILQTKPEKRNKSEDTPLALDPRKMLLNELLEESAADFPVDNYIKVNTHFAQNNYNVPENRCDIKKSVSDISGMDLTMPSSEHIRPGSHAIEKKNLERENIHANIISVNPSNLFGSLDMDKEQSNKVQSSVVETDYPKPLPKSRKSTIFPNFANDTRSMKMDASQMEFTEALPSKNFYLGQNNCTENILQANTNIFQMEQPNPAMFIEDHINSNLNFCGIKPGNSSSSQMEFTEAVPSKVKILENKEISGPDTAHMTHSKHSQDTMSNNKIPCLNLNESRIEKNDDVSLMEFTEALPSKNIGYRKSIANSHGSKMEHEKHFGKSVEDQLIPCFNVDESLRESNMSQMEFTEAIPSKDVRCHTLVTNIRNSSIESQVEHSKPLQKLMPSYAVTNFGIDESRSMKVKNSSQMEALPSKNIMPTNFKVDESRLMKSSNISQMEFTEALPSKNLMPANFNIDESGSSKTNNASQMEFTEALPSKNIRCHNLVAEIHNGITDSHIEHSKQLPKSGPSHTNLSNDESRTTKSNNVSQMEFTEALPSKNVMPTNLKIAGFSLAEDNNVSQMEFTEALPSKNIRNYTSVANIHATSPLPRNEQTKPEKKLMPPHIFPNFNIVGSKPSNSKNASQMEFTEVLPSKSLAPSNIDGPIHNKSNNTTQMELTEALPPQNVNLIGNKLEEKLNVSKVLPKKPPQNDIHSDMFFNLNVEGCKSIKKNNGCQIKSSEDHSSPNVELVDNLVINNVLTRPIISKMVYPNHAQDFLHNNMIPNLNTAEITESNNISLMEFTEALPSKNLPFNNVLSSKGTENRLLASSNVFEVENVNVYLNSEKNESNNYQAKSDFLGYSKKTSGVSQMELTTAVSSRPSTLNSSGVNKKVARPNVVLDRENIPPSQDLNESNSMEVTDLSFIDSENVVYSVNSESNAKITNQNSSTDLSKSTGKKLVNEGDILNMEFTEGLPMNVLHGGFKTEEKILTILKDVSQMKFTEALPTGNLQSALNPGGLIQNDQNNVVAPNHNLQTSNMEFTEVLPVFKTKQGTLNSKGSPEDISPCSGILQNKIISSPQNLNDCSSMDVTDVDNIPDDNTYENINDDPKIDKNKASIIKDYSDIDEPELKEKLSDDCNKNNEIFPLISGPQINFATERKTSSELPSDFSQLEFTEALPTRNQLGGKIVQDTFSNGNPLFNYKKGTLFPENDSLATSNMEFTEFLHKPDTQNLVITSETHCKNIMFGETETKKEIISPLGEGNFNNLCSENLANTKNVVKHAIQKNVNAQDSNKHASNESATENNYEVDNPQAKQGYRNFNVPSNKSNENIFPNTNQQFHSTVDTTQMEFTEAVQVPIHLKENIKIEEKVEDQGEDGLPKVLANSNNMSNVTQMEFTGAIIMYKCQSDLNQNVKDSNVNANNLTNNNSVSNDTKEVSKPNFENKLSLIPHGPSAEIEPQIPSHENRSEALIISDHKPENLCFNEENNIINDASPKICQNINAITNETPALMGMDFVTLSSHLISSDKDKSQELVESKELVKSNTFSSSRNLEVLSPMHIDQPSVCITDKKDSKVNSLRKIFENESKLDYPKADFNTPKAKQFAKETICENSNKSIINSVSSTSVVKTLTVDEPGEKKNLVHFNTPPVRIIKRRKTMGFPNPDESVQLLKSNSSDLATPLNDVSNTLNFQSSSQRRGIFDEKKKSAYDPEKGKEEWNRLLKNDAFMKERSFHFVSPCKWKYQFRWPVELILQIPDVEVNENSRKKRISLVSSISESDHISIFINNRMKKNMSVILSEEWLNSHCKTIKDLLFTIKFIEEEYNKLEPLIRSMKYFYQEFPFDFSSDRIIFKIVNLRKEFCFEVRIDVSYGQVKGKNIDVINHVGQISKTKVQQLFDQLQPNTERFYLFWQKLKKIDES